MLLSLCLALTLWNEHQHKQSFTLERLMPTLSPDDDDDDDDGVVPTDCHRPITD